MGNDDELLKILSRIGHEVGERVWQLPLYEEYMDYIRSEWADVKNAGGRWGGAVTAGVFLQQFVPDKVAWAHLDIAGTAWKSGKEKGATGRPVPLLMQYLLNRAGLSL